MKKIHLSLIIVASIVLIGSVTAGLIHLYIGQDTLPQGVRVAGWDVGGKKTDKVLKDLDARLQALENLPLILSVNGKEVQGGKLKLGAAGVTFEADAFKHAAGSLYEGSWLERISSRRQFPVNWDIVPHWDPSVLKTKFNAGWEEQQFGKPVKATRRITDDDRIVYTPETSVVRIDWSAFTDRMTAEIPKDFAPIADKSKSAIHVEFPLQQVKPDITVSSLKEEGVERKIIEFSTSLGASGPGRVYNVNSAAQAVNGMVLKPGDIFDYGKVIAAAEKKYGFREAPVILNGKLVPGIGGGICQVSSTVYNAAVLTGLDIVERRNHSLPVSYLPKGQDATFAEGSINFRFKNNTGKTLVIRASVKDKMLTIKFFGTLPQNVKYEIESKTVEILPITEKYVQNAVLPVGVQQVLQEGKPGYVVDTYQIKKVNDKVVERHKISRDTYRPQNRLIAVHSVNGSGNDSSGSKEQVVEDGLSGPNF